jgi:hypothetical protein
LVSLNDQPAFELPQRVGRREAFHLRPINPAVAALWVEEARIPLRLIAQEQQALGVGIEATDGIDARR